MQKITNEKSYFSAYWSLFFCFAKLAGNLKCVVLKARIMMNPSSMNENRI